MSILSKLFATKLEEEAITTNDVEDLVGREIDDIESLYDEVYTAPHQAEITYIPSPVGCEYCGNQSRQSDGRGGVSLVVRHCQK